MSYTYERKHVEDWLSFKDMSFLGYTNHTHTFCDTCISVVFRCTCPKNASSCIFKTMPKEKQITKKYHVWSGPFLRSAFFHTLVVYQDNQKQQIVSSSENKHPSNLQTTNSKLKYQFHLNDVECFMHDAFDCFIKLVNELHNVPDIENFIVDTLSGLCLNKTQQQPHVQLIENSYLVHILADRYIFPLVSHACKMLSFPMYMNQKNDSTWEHYNMKQSHKNQDLCLFSDETLSLLGYNQISYDIHKLQPQKQFYDTVNVTLTHEKNKCVCCNMFYVPKKDLKETVVNIKKTPTLGEIFSKHIVSLKSEREFNERQKYTSKPNSKNILSYTLDLQHNTNTLHLKHYLGDILNGQYSMYIGNLYEHISKDNSFKVSSFFSIHPKQSQIPTINLKDTFSITVSAYSDIIGSISIDTHFDFSIFKRKDIVEKYLLHTNFTFFSLTKKTPLEHNKCIQHKIFDKLSGFLSKKSTENYETQDNLMDYIYEKHVTSLFMSSNEKIPSNSPASSASSSQEENDSSFDDSSTEESIIQPKNTLFLSILFD